MSCRNMSLKLLDKPVHMRFSIGMLQAHQSSSLWLLCVKRLCHQPVICHVGVSSSVVAEVGVVLGLCILSIGEVSFCGRQCRNLNEQ